MPQRRWVDDVTISDISLPCCVTPTTTVNYFFRVEDYPDEGFPTDLQAGFLAQEVEKVIPEAVVNGRAGMKQMSYKSVTPYLLEAVKEQQLVIEEMQKQIHELQSQVKGLLKMDAAV